jgi:hypothetical protein
VADPGGALDGALKGAIIGGIVGTLAGVGVSWSFGGFRNRQRGRTTCATLLRRRTTSSREPIIL